MNLDAFKKQMAELEEVRAVESAVAAFVARFEPATRKLPTLSDSKMKTELVIAFSDGGGKAGAGKNKTATVQVRDPMPGGYLLIKSFRYNTRNPLSVMSAVEKAKKYVRDNQ